jgi:translocation and assembly module TamA
MIRLAAALLACALLAGCSSLKLFGLGGKDETSTPSVPLKTAYRVEVVAPDELRALLLNYLDLARFSTVPETDTMTPAELARLAAAAPVQARSLLETEGYFNADVKIESRPGSDGLPLLRVLVEPGPQVRVESVALTASGALQEAAASRDAAASAQLEALKRDFALQPGQPFRQSTWAAAKTATLARLRAEGYPAATWARTAARVDAVSQQATLELEAASGPLFRLGEVSVEGLERYDETSVRRLSTFRAGEPYSEKLLLDYQERLQKIGLFEGASVEVDPDPAKAAAAPVHVRVKELSLQQATLGVGISANTGPRVTLEHTHRRPFGLAWVAKNKFELGRDLDKWEGSLTSHPLDELYRNLIAGASERLKSEDEVVTSTLARIGRTQDTPRIERLYFAEALHATVDNNITGRSSADAYSGNYHWIYRDLDSVLLPTQGITLSAQAGLGYARSSTADNGIFSRLYGRYTWYRPLGASWYATARVEAGQVFARESVGLPDTLLFRAGGDESVRGYAYRTLGPTAYENADGTGQATVSSGRMLLTASLEVARPISPKRPAFWWAAFIDAGNAANHWNELHPALGYGVGLRWRSPVGPLRLDLAYGQEVHKARVHLSVGIAF